MNKHKLVYKHFLSGQKYMFFGDMFVHTFLIKKSCLADAAFTFIVRTITITINFFRLLFLHNIIFNDLSLSFCFTVITFIRKCWNFWCFWILGNWIEGNFLISMRFLNVLFHEGKGFEADRTKGTDHKFLKNET